MADEIAYRDLKLGEVIQAGDEWRTHDTGTVCWQEFHSGMHGRQVDNLIDGRCRRPYNITELLKQRDQAAHEYRLYREALTAEQEAHRVTMANGLQACKERDEAERLLTQARAAQERIITERDEWRRLFEVEHEARKTVIAERNEAHQRLSEQRELHAITAKDRDRLIVELSECQQQRQHLATALEELQRRRDAAAGVDTLTVGEVVENILSALEIASHALEYLADVGVHEEPGHYCGFSAAIAVVRKIKEAAK